MPELSQETAQFGGLAVVALYVGLNLLVLMVLGLMTSLTRQKTQTDLGHGESESMLRASRTHANAAEWIPTFLIGLAFAAFLGVPALWIHILGSVFTIARILHGIGLSGSSGRSFGRFVGALLTLICYLVLGLGLLVHSVPNLI